MSEREPKHLNLKIRLAQLAIGFERVWAALLWPALLATGVAVLILSGVAPLLPDAARLGLLGALGLGFLLSLSRLFRVSWPNRFEAMRRIERSSRLSHRPVTGFDDRLASGDGPQQAIWEAHKLRQLHAIRHVRIGLPRSLWRDLDRRALRVPAGLALIASLLLGPGDVRTNLADSLRMAPPPAAAQIVMDAWLKPPAYTARPPLLLTSPAMAERLKTEPEILAPENSILALRITNATAPSLSFHEINADGSAGAAVKAIAPRSKLEDGLFQAEAKLTRPVIVRVADGTAEIASWHVALIPDEPPSVAITEPPTGDSSGALSFKWKVGDDYGVTGVSSDISLADEQDGEIGFSGNGIFLFDAPKVPVNLRRSNAKEEEGSTTSDVAEHPWAGFMVEMTLTARDAAKHATQSETVTFRLPERLFTRPLAKALIEQRRSLILEPEEAQQVAGMLDALLTYPAGLIEGSGTHVAIAMVMSRLRAATGQDDIEEAIRLLWQIATGIEDGMTSNAKAELEALRNELERALAEGASPERIAELMEKLRSAMDRYLQSLMEETQRRMQRGGLDRNQPVQQGRSISPQDLKKMLDMIEKLAQSGANEAAKDLLAQLEDILRNLQPGMNAQQMPQQGESPLGQMLDQLSELMRRQQELMDDTQRMEQGEGQQQTPSPGQQGQSGGRSPGELADRQRGLGDMLQQLLDQFSRNGMPAPDAMGEAGQSMNGAQGSLRQGDREGALGKQGDALAKLREGAQGLAQQLLQQGQGQQGSTGRHGEARGDDRDPLGRPMPQRGEDYGPDRNILPSELAIRKAREILDMLRSRSNAPDMPRIERDYIDRLLRGLY
ncbi:MAG: TIGR02302 family protein [Alphaproteobacteria bacterium]|nr:TIGR02302 family protein [Alphaproteobacteria bacterium]